MSSAVTVTPKGSEDSSVMSCLSALDSQLATLLSVPEILFLRHRVFREYAKIAVGPDFIHTLPSFVIVIAVLLVLWKNPPSFAWLMDLVGVHFATFVYKSFQETEYRDISYPWWQRVWSSYYPAPTQPPVMSACFISWIIAMSIGIIALGCAINIDHLKTFVEKISNKLRNALAMTKSYIEWSQDRTQQILLLSSEANAATDDSEMSSVCDDGHSEISTDANAARGDIRPISYGTNWMPPPNFSAFKEAQRKISLKSFHTVMGVNDVQDPDKFAAKQFRHRRGCHTVIPGNSSEQSSGC
ncbi:hypothetical protein EAG_14445 [Camponotus floridanus]|uniref:Uncharacterized protein n=1 Tax=Camponotus floridanus TaxID=104421 RepID=E2ANM4_CAMFO|nr:hypothetical protein EAG_14445 [Camponotus floridanus]